MNPATQMTKAQEHRFYRHAVQASLEHFYGKSELEARQLVKGWWGRLSEGGSLDSGLFLHAEPINTAAGVAEARAIPITAEIREAYHRILDQSRERAIAQAKTKTMTRGRQPKKDDSAFGSQLVHISSSGKSGAARRVALNALAKKAKDEKAARKQHVACG